MKLLRESRIASIFPGLLACCLLLFAAGGLAAPAAEASAMLHQGTLTAQDNERLVGLNESDAIQLVASRAALEAIDHLGAKQDRYWAILSGLAVLVGVIVFFFVGNRIGEMKRSITNDLLRDLSGSKAFQESIGASLETQLTDYMGEEIRKTKQEIAKIRLDSLATEMENSDQFSDGVKFSVMELLRIASEDPEVLTSPSFRLTFERISKNFMSADLSFEIDEIMGMFRERFISLAATAESQQKKAVFSLIAPYIQHYGQRLIGSSDLPHEIPAEMAAVANICERIKYREFVLPYFLIWTHGRAKIAVKKEDEAKLKRSLKSLIQDYRHLTDGEKKVTVGLLGFLSDETKLAKKPTAQIIRLVERTTDFLSEYGSEFSPPDEGAPPPSGAAAPDVNMMEKIREMLQKGAERKPS